MKAPIVLSSQLRRNRAQINMNITYNTDVHLIKSVTDVSVIFEITRCSVFFQNYKITKI